MLVLLVLTLCHGRFRTLNAAREIPGKKRTIRAARPWVGSTMSWNSLSPQGSQQPGQCQTGWGRRHGAGAEMRRGLELDLGARAEPGFGLRPRSCGNMWTGELGELQCADLCWRAGGCGTRLVCPANSAHKCADVQNSDVTVLARSVAARACNPCKTEMKHSNWPNPQSSPAPLFSDAHTGCTRCNTA